MHVEEVNDAASTLYDHGDTWKQMTYITYIR